MRRRKSNGNPPHPPPPPPPRQHPIPRHDKVEHDIPLLIGRDVIGVAVLEGRAVDAVARPQRTRLAMTDAEVDAVGVAHPAPGEVEAGPSSVATDVEDASWHRAVSPKECRNGTVDQYETGAKPSFA